MVHEGINKNHYLGCGGFPGPEGFAGLDFFPRHPVMLIKKSSSQPQIERKEELGLTHHHPLQIVLSGVKTVIARGRFNQGTLTQGNLRLVRSGRLLSLVDLGIFD